MTDLDALGGKAANLVALRAAGFPVPPFVVWPTAEYRAFVAAHRLDAVIAAALPLGPAAAADAIRAAFRRPLLPDQRARLADAVAPLLDAPVAVRSSATAEDLPDASFAGQQDTFLGVVGLDAVCDAVVECWSSLWTGRAISYRDRNAVPHASVALAVVVQRLVDAEASGVLFTADPLTGRRGVTTIDAVFGLGEELVAGRVTPDHVEVETATGRVLTRTQQGEQPALSEAQIAALVALGAGVAERFGRPQDIEWTRVGDEVQLVQTRPITSLYPLPERGPEDAVWVSFGAFQGMLQPITPLGQDALRLMMAGGAEVLGGRPDYHSNAFLQPAGGRLWVRIDRLLANPLGHRLTPRFLTVADPNAARLAERFAAEEAYAARPGSGRRAQRRLLGRMLPVAPRIASMLRAPDATRARLEGDTGALLDALAQRLAAAAAIRRPDLRLAARLRALEQVAPGAFRVLLPDFMPIMGPSMLMMQRLRGLAAASGVPQPDATAAAVLRSLPGNVTTAMDLALWDAARAIAADPASRRAIETTDAGELAASYLAGRLPRVAQAAVAGFLDAYGMRGVAEIDLGTPRWRERPDGVFRTLASYLALDADRAPDAVYAAGRREADAAVDALAGALAARGRRLEARQARFLASRLRGIFGARETPKFTLVRALGQVRTALQASGADLVDAGLLDSPDDVFFLYLDELHGAFGRPHLRPLVAERRAAHEREGRRARIPIVLVGDGRTFYDAGTPAGDADLAGLGVSPGIVEAPVRVVDDPHTSTLLPGEILVCRGTDPAWTPLFLTASGLVTEVGGLMTHGSVVAREYGLPAVVGVAGATVALQTGWRIRLDGSSGAITILAR